MLKLEVVTPEKRVVDAEVDSVTVPTASGEVGIMPSHAPLISAMKPGILSYTAKGSGDKLVVSGGFVEVSGDVVSVLVDTAETPGEIQVEAARMARDEAEKKLSAASASSIEEKAAVMEALEHAESRLQAASGR